MNPDMDLIGDPTRRSMLALLRVEGEVCVCELAAALDHLQPSASRHLARLREGGWVASRREGGWIHYRLASLPGWATKLVDTLVSGGVPTEVLGAARSRLAAYRRRPA